MREQEPAEKSCIARTLTSLLIVAAPLAACAQQELNTKLQSELLQMGRTDQQVRKQAVLLARDRPHSKRVLMSAVKDEERVETKNLGKLEEIIDKYGWPGRKLVGEKASGAALIVLQHADMEHKRKYLPLVRAAAADGDIPTLYLARLEDDIRAGEGRPQIYGTRVVAKLNGKPTLYPVEDPKHLDMRREAIGLPPIDVQLKQMEAEIGMHISRGNVPAD